MFLNKCCWDCENVCKLFLFNAVSVAYGQMFVKIVEKNFGVETYECALAEKTGTKRAILTKIGINSIWNLFTNRYITYHFYFFKWLLLVWTFRIYMVFIVLNHSKCSVFSLKHSHFTINKEGQNNGSTWPLRAKSLEQKNTFLSHLSAFFYLFEWKSTN